MNYRSIGLLALAVLALVSCKNEVATETQTVGTKTVLEESVNSVPVEEQRMADPNGSYGVMNFTALEHDFGTINAENTVETVFTFTNTGTADVLILNATGSCGCTVPEYPKAPIAPGQKADIKVSFSPKGKNGMQSKTVTLTTNTAKGIETLTVKANIVK